jgi:hypothetical protein
MKKQEDWICFNELKNMFNSDNERIASLLELTAKQEESKSKIVEINSKINKEKYSRL